LPKIDLEEENLLCEMVILPSKPAVINNPKVLPSVSQFTQYSNKSEAPKVIAPLTPIKVDAAVQMKPVEKEEKA
jgi:hypothetical protein